MKRSFSGKVTGAKNDGLSVVHAQDYPDQTEEFVMIRHAMTKEWAVGSKPLEEILAHGGYCAPVSLERDWRFFLDKNYHCYILCRDGRPISFLDGMVREMVAFKENEDEEFFRGGPEFMDVLNWWPYEFGSNVGYLYYLVKENVRADPTGLRLLYRTYLDDMRDRYHLDCIVTDLPTRIRGKALENPKITRLAADFGWKMMPRWVASIQGDIWQQAALILNGQPLTLQQKVLEEFGHDEDFRHSGVWQCIVESHHLELEFAKEFAHQLMNDGVQVKSLPESVIGINAA